MPLLQSQDDDILSAIASQLGESAADETQRTGAQDEDLEAELFEDTTEKRNDEEDEDGEDLMENMERDYRPIPELDVYDAENLAPDDESVAELGIAERRALEEEMDRRDADRRGATRVRRDLLYEGDEDDAAQPTTRRRRLRALTAARLGESLIEDDEEANESVDSELLESIENLEDMKGHSVREWVSMIGPYNEIKNRFRHFLRTFKNERGVSVYRERIRRLVETNGEF